MRKLLLLAAALGLSACTPKYVYHPEENATARVAGQVAADYQVPPQAPEGDVRIASFGISKVAPENAPPNETLRALHLRMVVANNSPSPWKLDTRDQFVEIAGYGESRPAYAWAHEAGQLPVVTVPARGKATVDLFYPLPSGLQQADKLPHFDAVWNVQTAQQRVTQRTPFERLKVEPAYAYGYGGFGPSYGWGPWWYDPLYPTGGFAGATVLPPVYVSQPVYIGTPTWRR